MFRWRLCLDGLTVQEDWKWYRVEVYYLIFLILMGICESMGSGGVDMCAAEQTPAMCATGSCYLCARGEAHKYGEYVHFLRRGSGRGSPFNHRTVFGRHGAPLQQVATETSAPRSACGAGSSSHTEVFQSMRSWAQIAGAPKHQWHVDAVENRA